MLGLEGIVTRARELWGRLTKKRYTRALEAENMFLRAENRALLNSILGIAGLPPVSVTAHTFKLERDQATHVPKKSSRRERTPVRTAGADRRATGGSVSQTNREPMLAAPLRRRSWQQITRMLEFESARKNAEQ
jgi:hypothetical protein